VECSQVDQTDKQPTIKHVSNYTRMKFTFKVCILCAFIVLNEKNDENKNLIGQKQLIMLKATN
jgi:hypothetical protein